MFEFTDTGRCYPGCRHISEWRCSTVPSREASAAKTVNVPDPRAKAIYVSSPTLGPRLLCAVLDPGMKACCVLCLTPRAKASCVQSPKVAELSLCSAGEAGAASCEAAGALSTPGSVSPCSPPALCLSLVWNKCPPVLCSQGCWQEQGRGCLPEAEPPISCLQLCVEGGGGSLI